MLKFYDQFAQQNQADVKLQKETARAYRRVGDIQRAAGAIRQGGDGLPPRLGDLSGAGRDAGRAVRAV